MPTRCVLLLFFIWPPCVCFSVFKDVNTPSPFIEKFQVEGEGSKAALPDHIYLDAMGFGMGCSCLQVRPIASERLC